MNLQWLAITCKEADAIPSEIVADDDSLHNANQIEGLQNISPIRYGQLAFLEVQLGNTELTINEFNTAIKLTDQTWSSYR